MPENVELAQMLEARERRVSRQRELLDRCHLPLVSFTMNIAGPVKNSPLIRRGFSVVNALLRGQLARVKAKCVFSEEYDAPTGCEALYVVDMDAPALKSLTEELEDSSDLGRLFDMDVLSETGEKLDRKIPRVSDFSAGAFIPSRNFRRKPRQFCGTRWTGGTRRQSEVWRAALCSMKCASPRSRDLWTVPTVEATGIWIFIPFCAVPPL